MKEEAVVETKPVIEEEVVKPKKKAEDEYITINFANLGKGLSMPVAILLSAIILSIGIGSGLYFGLRGTNTGTNTGTTTPTGTADPLALSNFPEASISVGKGAVKGKLEPGKIVIVEFSDLMCVFCRQFTSGHDVQTGTKGVSAYSQVLSEYVDKGTVAFVYRHFPLPIHEPAATQASLFSECVRQISGDGAFFKFVDEFFEKLDKITVSGASGMEMDRSLVESIITSSGSDKGRVVSCYEKKESQAAVSTDVSDAQALGQKLVGEGKITGLGTPGFIVGKLQSDGKTVVGRLIPGAYPFQAFQTVIQSLQK